MKHATQISIDFLHDGNYDADRLEKLISLALFEQGMEFLGSDYTRMDHAYAGLLDVTFETYPDMFTDYENGVENENYDHEYRSFTVPRVWATIWIRQYCDGITLAEFENVYEWDWSYQMYENALAEGVIIEEHIEER